MGNDDRLGFDGNPQTPLGQDSGDLDGVTGVGDAQYASGGYRDGVESLPESDGRIFNAYHRKALGIIDISDVIAPNRFRRVYQSVRIQRNDLYQGPIVVQFRSSIGAMINEELGGLAPAPQGTTIPSRTTTVTTNPNGTIRSPQQNRNQAPPQVERITTPGQTTQVDGVRAEQYGAWETFGSQVHGNTDLEQVDEAMDGLETDGVLETLGEIVRPRAWARHTILQIQFRMPLMEAMLPASSLNLNTGAFGEHLLEVQRNAARQNTIEEFPLFAGQTREIEIPYPVGASIPVHFDIINHNPIYAANVNISATVFVTR